MELLKEIKDKEFPKDESGLNYREASRAVVFDENNLVPMLFVSKGGYHKLPGGMPGDLLSSDAVFWALQRQVQDDPRSIIGFSADGDHGFRT